jgi:hypothetical protein
MLKRAADASMRVLGRETGITDLAQYSDWGLGYSQYVMRKGEPDLRKDHIVKICSEMNEMRPSQMISAAVQRAEEEALRKVAENPEVSAGVAKAFVRGAKSLTHEVVSRAATRNEPPAAAGPGPSLKERATGMFGKFLPRQGRHEIYGDNIKAARVIREGEGFVNQYGHKLSNVPAMKQNFLAKEARGSGDGEGELTYFLRQRTSARAPPLDERAIAAIPTDHPSYGLFKGQFMLPWKFYTELERELAKGKPIGKNGGARKTHKAKRFKKRKTRRHR